MRVGFTGHQVLPKTHIADIQRAIGRELGNVVCDLVGIGSLADGADQLFGAAVLGAGGELHVVIPSEDYEGIFSDDALERYRDLLNRATFVTCLPFKIPNEQAFFAAGRYVAENCDRLLAVWDGKKAKGLGGTADVVEYAQARNLPVTVIWPDGAIR